MNFFVGRPCPLPSSRIEFDVLRPPPIPPVAARMEFGPELIDTSAATENQFDDEDEDEGEVRTRARTARTTPKKSKKFPRPHGEPGRPNSGGFNLITELVKIGWTKESVKEMTEAVHELAKEKLDLTKSFKKQDHRQIKNMMKDKNWAKLKDFEDCWPVRCVLKCKLKNGAAAARRSELRDTQARLQAIMNRRGMSPDGSTNGDR